MVDCRPGAGAPPLELSHPQPNGGAPNENHHNQAGGSGDMVAHGIASPASVRSSTPASTNTLTTYTNVMNPGGGGVGGNGYPVAGVGAMPGVGAGGACAPYVCGVKSVVWCGGAAGGGGLPHAPPPPHAHVPPPPPPGVNAHVFKSMQPNGSDLPMNDIPTLRFYYNLGVECVWATYGPPRHYSPRELAHELAHVSLAERPHHAPDHHKHKPAPNNDKPPLNNQPKGNGQRPLLGPRFKRGGGNQDGNQNSNHNQNKHNNNMGNKGPNNRRNSHGEPRGPHVGYSGAGEGECVMEQPMITLPYIPYPPPMYPIQYYPVETDPAMMGMMGGMGYVGYEEGVYEGGMQAYYPPAPHYPPPHPHPHPHHVEHK